MKKQVFNRYVRSVCYWTGVKEDDLFSKNKLSDISQARHLLFYLCHKRKIKGVKIAEYMEENGYITHSATVSYGIKKIKKQEKEDRDLRLLIKKIK